MSTMNTIKTTASLVAIAVLATACSTPVPKAEVKSQENVVAKKQDDDKNKGQGVTQLDVTKKGFDESAAKNSIYFDFDQYVVKTEYASVVDGNAKNLTANKGKKILIQGNTDERGGREYNLALGQKRAEAVRKSMALLGVPEAQMEAVSLGKEKPRATGSDEAAWAQNRRADILYSAK